MAQSTCVGSKVFLVSLGISRGRLLPAMALPSLVQWTCKADVWCCSGQVCSPACCAGPGRALHASSHTVPTAPGVTVRAILQLRERRLPGCKWQAPRPCFWSLLSASLAPHVLLTFYKILKQQLGNNRWNLEVRLFHLLGHPYRWSSRNHWA